MTELDQAHLRAAEGWLALGDWASANEELEEIEATQRGKGPVLAIRARVYAAAGDWDTAFMLGNLVADSGQVDAEVLFSVAKAACMMGDLERGRRWLTEAVNKAPSKDFRLRILEEPAFTPLLKIGTHGSSTDV